MQQPQETLCFQVLRASRQLLEKVNLANDVKICQGRIIAGKRQRTASADVLKNLCA